MIASVTKEVEMEALPLYDRILVERLEASEKTKGGIYIPETAKEKLTEGKVVAVGKGKLLDNGHIQMMELKEGDLILFGKFSGTEVTVAGKEMLMMREDEVYLKLVPKKGK